MNRYALKNEHYLAIAISACVLMPVFFQIQSGIFRDTSMVYDAKGVIGKLPIPLSVVTCFIGIPIIGRYKNARLAFAFALSTFVLMLISLLITTGGHLETMKTRSIVLLQFILPMFGMMLGQLYEKIDDKIFFLSRVSIGVTSAIIPLQLIYSWSQGFTIIIPNVFFFSIYQHLQYVPVIFAAAFVIGLFALGNLRGFRKWLVIFLPVVALYLVVSSSLLGMVLLLLGVLSYLFFFKKITKKIIMKLFIMLIVVASITIGYLYYYRGQNMTESKFQFIKIGETTTINIPGVETRWEYWKYHGSEVFRDARSFLIGNKRIYDRSRFRSAHNYYLDFIFHFGFIALVPMLILIMSTVLNIYRKRGYIRTSPELFGLTLVVVFLLFVDNSLKVTLRQPYPGIFTFFLWGILISRLTDYQSVQ